MLNSLVEPEPQHKPAPKKPNIGNYIIVELGNNNNNLIKYFSPFELENSIHTELVNSVLSQKKSSGDIYSNNTHYSYLIKNTPKKGIITVELSSNNNQVLITFKNTGNGISLENIDKIFERFYRVDSSRNSSIGGYGLGLSIAKSIVETHKGKIY